MISQVRLNGAKTMMRRSILAFGAAVLLVAAGCGGDGVSESFGTLNAYAGSWTGAWNSATLSDTGTLTISIAANGSLTGTMSRSNGDVGSVAGLVEPSGNWNANAGFGANGNFIMNGTMTRASGQLIGSMTFSYLGTTYGGTFSLAPGSGGSGE